MTQHNLFFWYFNNCKHILTGLTPNKHFLKHFQHRPNLLLPHIPVIMHCIMPGKKTLQPLAHLTPWPFAQHNPRQTFGLY
jgi:hypothetical protein